MVSMNRIFICELMSLFIVGLFLGPIILGCFPIPVQKNNFLGYHNKYTITDDNKLIIDDRTNSNTPTIDSSYFVPGTNSISSAKSNEVDHTSIRDKNNNKLSDQLDQSITNGERYLDVIIMYNSEITPDHIQALEELGLEIENVYFSAAMVSMHRVPVELVTTLTNLPDVERIENYGTPILYSDIATPASKARESELYSPNTAWELGYTGKGANIAVVDTGVDNGHPSLAGKWLGGVDLSKPKTIFTPRDGTFDADDTNGHGTTCSGIAMGTGAPDNVYMGTAPDAKLVDVRIGTMIGYAPGELLQSYYDASLEGIQWVMDHQDDKWPSGGSENQGIDILSLSWGIDVGGSSDGSDTYSTLLDRAVESGVIVCHAAGNSGPDNDGFDGFAAASNGISVAATNDLNTLDRADDIIAEYSSRGPRHDNGDGNPYNELKPDIAAPGTGIMQAQFDIIGDGSGNGYGNRGSGTSYATPLVAGVVALMLEANPNLTPELAKEILHLTAERRGEPTIPELDPFWNKDFGWGIVDAYKAVKLSASISDVKFVNTNLQCFITSIDGLSENLTSGTVNIQGVAFSKNDDIIDKIELSVDDGKWLSITKLADDGIYFYWNYALDTTNIENGNHTLNARATGGESYSLTHSMDMTVQNEPGVPEEFVVGQFSILVIALLVVTVSVLVYIYYRKKRSK